MGILERLKNLLGIEVDTGDKIVITGKEPVEIEKEDEIIRVNPDALETTEQREELENIIKTAPSEIGEITEEIAEKDIESIRRVKGVPRINETLDFFQGKISENHLDILEKSLYMRETFEKGEPVERRKRGITKRYGRTGGVIANMCTAGYFDKGGYLRELYHEGDFSEDQFRREFEEIIKTQPFSIFVSRMDSTKSIIKELKEKLQKHKKYGIKFLDVRGIGTANIEKVIRSVGKLEEEIDEIDYETKLNGKKCVIRIDPSSVEGLEKVQ